MESEENSVYKYIDTHLYEDAYSHAKNNFQNETNDFNKKLNLYTDYYLLYYKDKPKPAPRPQTEREREMCCDWLDKILDEM